MIVENFDRSFDTPKVIRLLGGRKGNGTSSSTLRRIRSMSGDLDTLVQPRLSYRRIGLAEICRGGIVLEDGTRFKSVKLAKTLARAREVCCFVATVGPAIDMAVKKQMRQRRFADAYVLDAIGSMSAENVVEQFYQRTADRLAARNQALTLRFSPGYCDWPLDEQRPLFALFDDRADLDVTLSDSCLMSPRKSVSGLFGILPAGAAGSGPAFNPCAMCCKHDCIARRMN